MPEQCDYIILESLNHVIENENKNEDKNDDKKKRK